MNQYYIIHVWRSVEPTLVGPWMDSTVRDNKARELRNMPDSHDEDGIFWLDIINSKITVGPYSNAFMEYDPDYRR